MDCSGGSYKDVDNCKMSYCPFWMLRKGTPTQKELDVFVKELAKDDVKFSPLTLKLQNIGYVPSIRVSGDILLKPKCATQRSHKKNTKKGM